jgi:hypothetical protein
MERKVIPTHVAVFYSLSTKKVILSLSLSLSLSLFVDNLSGSVF